MREIEPWDLETVLDLSRQLARADQHEEALMLLEALSRRVAARELRGVRALQWRILPTLGQSWLYLRARFARRAPQPLVS